MTHNPGKCYYGKLLGWEKLYPQIYREVVERGMSGIERESSTSRKSAVERKDVERFRPPVGEMRWSVAMSQGPAHQSQGYGGTQTRYVNHVGNGLFTDCPSMQKASRSRRDDIARENFIV